MKRLHRHLRIFILLLVAWTMCGCAAVTLRDAQDHFNKASSIELRAMDASLLRDNPEASPAEIVSVLNEYRLCNQTVTELIDQKSASLKKDNLLGAAYVLKAMSLWRISDLQGDQPEAAEKPSTQPAAAGGSAANTRQELLTLLNQMKDLQNKKELSLATRDRVLYKALYGFYDHDGGRMEKDYAKAVVWFRSAGHQMGGSVAEAPAMHPVRIYIGAAQLRTLAAWNLVLNNERIKCERSSDPPACRPAVKKDQDEILENAKNVYCNLKPFWDGNDGQQVKSLLNKLTLAVGASPSCP